MTPASAAGVSRTCGADAVANTAAVLCAPPSGPCSATAVALSANIEVHDHGCVFDLGGRALTVSKTFEMTGAGFIVVNNAGNVTITSTGKLKARGDFVLATATPTPHVSATPTPAGGTKVPTPTPTQTFAGTGPPGVISGGSISLKSSGTITHAGVLDVSGNSAGSIDLDAVGDVVVQNGAVTQGVGIAADADADGGSVDLTSRTGSVMVKAVITVTGDAQAEGGAVTLTAARNIDVQQAIDASGGGFQGGSIDIDAGDDIAVTRSLTVDSNAGAGDGGTITLAAGEDFLGGIAPGGALTVTDATLRLNGSDSETSSGGGGELDLSSAGPLKLLGSAFAIRANGGNLFDGDGGFATIDSTDGATNHLGPLDGDVVIDGAIILQSGGDSGAGGELDVSAGRALTLNAAIDVSGADEGGAIAFDAGGSVAISGVITATGRLATARPGTVDVVAGQAADATLTVAQNVLAPGGTANAVGSSISLAGCGLTIAPNVKVNGQGGTNTAGMSGASQIDLIARHPMQLGTAAQFLANPGGKIFTVHPPGQNPVVGAGVVFNPARTDQATTTGGFPECPVCGDGIRQRGEACDKGAAADGACCNADCSALTCATATPHATATPVATVTRTATRTTTPTAAATVIVVPTVTATAARTTTPTRTATPTRTTTPARTSTAAASPTRTSTAVATATRTSTPGATPTPTSTPTATRTATPTPARTGTPTATATRTSTPVATASRTSTPIATASRTSTPVATASRTSTPVASATPTRSVTPTLVATVTPSVFASATPTPLATPIVGPTATPAPEPVGSARALTSCQAAAAKASSALVAAETKVLQRCVTSALKCVQTKIEPVASLCRTTAAGKCANAVQAFRAKKLPKLAAALASKCGPDKVVASDLLGADVLGFDAIAPVCGAFGVSIGSIADVSDCLTQALACRAEAALGVAMPRAADFLADAGVVTGLCLPAPAGDLGGLPNPKPEGAAATACQAGIAKAALTTLTRTFAAHQACVALVLKCRLGADAPATCIDEIAPKCAALAGRLNASDKGVFAKAEAAVAKACAKLSDADLLATPGVGFALTTARCAALGVPTLAATTDVAACVVREQRCAAADLLGLAMPRAGESLAAVGESATDGLACPAFTAPPAP